VEIPTPKGEGEKKKEGGRRREGKRVKRQGVTCKKERKQTCQVSPQPPDEKRKRGKPSICKN